MAERPIKHRYKAGHLRRDPLRNSVNARLLGDLLFRT